ncbi:MAG TPA: RT0821/Lpp0805 family surface protein [Usitatibacter sp.]|jgi:surface antigen|nr:RT0821/Lpp0805 family surface protein [Usitatibacter sp.]
MMAAHARFAKRAVAMATVLALAACESPPTKEQKGAVAGAVVGGVVGSTIGGGAGRTTAIVVGTIAGALIGSHIGKRMDEADRLKAAQVLETAPTGQGATWKNPDSGDQFTMTPTRTYETSSGPCRDYTVNATVEGKPESVQGKACRQQDGSWKTE